MKKWIMRQARTNGISSQTNASLTLEAALIIPLLLLLFYFFYILLLANMVQMSMKSLASTTVNSIASQIHAVDQVGQWVKTNTDYTPGESSVNSSSQETSYLETQLLNMVPEPVHTMIVEGKKGNWWPAVNVATTTVGKKVIEELILQLPESRGLDKERLSLVYLQLPDVVNYTDATVKLTLQYELPYSLPFFSEPFIIREQATQRAWLPDAKAANFEITEDDMFIQFISLEPNPVRPGHKARLTVKTRPHTSLSVEIHYKSGKSKAKNLGAQIANAQGEITWEWHVSGNTTEGLWGYVVQEVSGDATLNGVFEVKKRGSL